MPNKKKICLPCEREKAKLPTYEQLAKQRAKKENKTIAIYFDTEDKKYIISSVEQAERSGYAITAYFTSL